MASREAYLEALGLTDWVRRDTPGGDPSPADEANPVVDRAAAAPERPAAEGERPSAPDPAPPHTPESTPQATNHRSSVFVGPGSGSCLYLCGPEDDESTPLASDLARVLGTPPVWGRVDDEAGGQPLERLIAERLFTQVVVFGEASAQRIFGGQAPSTCGPARVTVVDDLRRLGNDAGARRSCWSALKSAGVVTGS